MRYTLSATYMIWKRELLGWWRDRTRIVGSLAIPVIFLFVLGSGFSGAMGPLTGRVPGGGIDFQQFIFPGVVAMSVFLAALFNSVSLVFDREFGSTGPRSPWARPSGAPPWPPCRAPWCSPLPRWSESGSPPCSSRSCGR